jgi:anti-sigma factor RsiW
MIDCDEQLLGAYHDGELSPAERARVETHLLICSHCAAELAKLQAISKIFADRPPVDLTTEELDRLHAAVDQSADRPMLRIMTAIAAVAASVLILSAVWLNEISRRDTSPQSNVARSVESWETVAVTLKPTPAEMFEGGAEPATAKAGLDEWMLQEISPEQN